MSDTWLPVMVFSIIAFLVGLQAMNVLQEAEGGHEPSPFTTIEDKCNELTMWIDHGFDYLGYEMQPVGEWTEEIYYVKWCEKGLLIEILEEEKKQTALLDHIDCMKFDYQANLGWNDKVSARSCGYPLNITGVWNP